jgi:hypothetical protein
MFIALMFAALALPGAAAAQAVPPGNSGVDQYQESIPGAGGDSPTGPASGTGNAPSSGKGSGGAASGGEARISPSTAQQLNKLGPDGKAAGAIAAATAPGPSKDSSASSGSTNDSGPGMGWLLPVILGLTLAGALAVIVMRRRGAPPGPA